MSLMSPWLALAQPFAHALYFSVVLGFFFPLSDAPLADLRPLYRSHTSPISCLDPPVNSCAEWGPNCLGSGDYHSMSKPWGSFSSLKCFFFRSVSGVSTANIAQASNSHACDLTPLAANVFSGAEPAWFRKDGNFNLPSIIFPIITPFTAFSLHPGVPRGSGAAEKEGIVHSVPNFNMSGAKKERGGVYTLLGGLL